MNRLRRPEVKKSWCAMTDNSSKNATLIGIDLGGGALKAALVSGTGQVLAECGGALQADNAESTLSRLSGAVTELTGHSASHGNPAALGIGVPGLVNNRTGRVEAMRALPALVGVDIVSELSRQTHLPVLVDNNANAVAYGEWRVGAARGKRDVFVVAIGNGIGAGLIIDGRLYRGATGFAGEFGHMTIDPEGIECACGNIGCLETVASGPNIVRRTRDRLLRDRTSSLSRLGLPRDRELIVEDIARAARDGDEMSQVMMERTGMFLGVAIAAVINLLNVEMVVLTGGVMEAGDLILKPTTDETRRRSFPPSFNSTQIVAGEIGSHAGVVGAALLAGETVR